MKLTEHFTVEEMTQSDVATRHGLDNFPGEEEFARLTHTAECLEQVRSILGCPVHVTSGYRAPAINALVGGSPLSQHCLGEAADFIAPDYGRPLEVARTLSRANLDYDQLIQEGTWIHISFREAGNRRQTLTAVFHPHGKTTYIPGIV